MPSSFYPAKSIKMFLSFLLPFFLLINFLLFTGSQSYGQCGPNPDPTGVGTPAKAFRPLWGDSWGSGGTITNGGNGAIVACASAGTSSQPPVSGTTTYCGTNFPITPQIFAGKTFINLQNVATTFRFPSEYATPPAMAWYNFDIRPFAGTFQVQIGTSNQKQSWALYYTTNYTTSLNTTPPLQNLTGSGALVPVAYGFSTPPAWYTIKVPSFANPSNYYLVIWDTDGQATWSNPGDVPAFQARYGCGGSGCTLEKSGTDVVTCNSNGTYTACAEFLGSGGKWQIVDNAIVKATNYSVTRYQRQTDGTFTVYDVVSSATAPSFVLSSLSETFGEVTGLLKAKICVTYTVGNPYNISLLGQTPSSTPSGYVGCETNGAFSGPSPNLPSTYTVGGGGTTCPNSAGVNITLSGSQSGVTYTVFRGSTELDSKTGDGSALSFGPYTVVGTYTIVGKYNNTLCAIPMTGSAAITQDNSAPNITTQAKDKTVECGPNNAQELTDWLSSNGGAAAENPSEVNWTNNYGSGEGKVSLSDGCGETGSVTVTFTATDGCGNPSTTSATFTIVDTKAPTWTDADGVKSDNVTCTADLTALLAYTPAATDNCSGVIIEGGTPVYNPTDPAKRFGCYTITRTWTVKDNCGNTNATSYVQTINVTDNTAPTWTTAAGTLNTTVTCNLAALDDALNLKPKASDDCSGATVTLVSTVSTQDQCNTTGTYTITRKWKATDGCNNATTEANYFTQVITVNTNFTVGCYTIRVSTYYDASLNRTTFTWTVKANGCAAGLSNILFEVPLASSTNCRISSRVNYPILYSPVQNYTGTTGTPYKVLYPQTEGKGKGAFTGIKFEVSGGEGIKNNQTETYVYTLCGNYSNYVGRVSVKAGTLTTTGSVDPDCLCKSDNIPGAANYTTQLGSGLNLSEPVTNNVNSTEIEKLILTSRIFPNPHNGKFNVQFTAIADGAATVEVYTMDGKRVQQKALQVRKGTQQTVPFTVPGKSSLIYRVINGGQSSSGRILPN